MLVVVVWLFWSLVLVIVPLADVASVLDVVALLFLAVLVSVPLAAGSEVFEVVVVVVFSSVVVLVGIWTSVFFDVDCIE